MAQARTHGVGKGRLRGSDLVRPLHGVRQLAGDTGGSVADETGNGAPTVRPASLAIARAAALVLPGDAAFSHCTAALLHGFTLPRSHEHALPLHVCRTSNRNPVDRPQVRAHKGLESRRVTTVAGLRVVAGVDVWVDLGSVLGIEDLVVIGDQIARRAGSVDLLHRVLERRGAVRGVRSLREALRWVRIGSESAMESRVRLLFARYGLPEPELNGEITAADGSGFVCRGDFVWRDQKVVGEYQGRHHFGTFDRGDDDISRRLLVEDDDWKYVELTKRDYFNPARRVAMVRRLARHLGVEVVADRPPKAWNGRFATTSTCLTAGPDGVSVVRRR